MNVPIDRETLAEHEALCQGVGLADIGRRTQIELTGADRATFLHNLCTNDIKKLTPGQACEAFFTNVQGKILAHGYVLCYDERLVFDTVADQAEAILAHLDRYLIREDVVLMDRSAEQRQWLLAGQRCSQVLESLAAGSLSEQAMRHSQISLAGCDISRRRLEFAGRNSLLLSCPAERAEEVEKALQAAGATLCGAEAAEILRVEAGTPLYGRDISDKNLPQELARDDRAISFTKGCYLGQETVARIDALGHVNRYLVGLRIAGETIPPAGSAISAGEKTVGEITSAVYSPRLAAPLALAYVRREHAALGSHLMTESGPAERIELPLAGAI